MGAETKSPGFPPRARDRRFTDRQNPEAGGRKPDMEERTVDMDMLKARMNLQLIAPLLEDIVAHDAGAAALVKGWNCAVQIQAGADPALAVHLDFAYGRPTAVAGPHQRPAVVLNFQSPQNLNAHFGAPGEKTGVKVRGLWHFIILKNFAKLLTYIKRYLKPREEQEADPAAQTLRAGLLLRISVMGLPFVAEGDPGAQKVVSNIPDGACAWRIKPDGPAFHVMVRGGVLSATAGDAPDAAARVEFKDAPTALAVLTGKTDPMKAMVSGDFAITGQTQIALMLSSLQQKIGKILNG